MAGRNRSFEQTDMEFSWYSYEGISKGKPISGGPYTVNTYEASKISQTMQDFEVGDFQGAINSGQIVPTNFCNSSKVSTTVSPLCYNYIREYPYVGYIPGDYVKYTGSSGTIVNLGFAPVSVAIPEDEAAALYDSVIVGARAKMTSCKMLGVASMMEFGSSVTMLKSAVKTLDRVTRWSRVFLSKLKVSKAGTLNFSVGTLANLWMEWRMAWRPFFGEVDDFTSTLWRIDNNDHRQSFRDMGAITVSAQEPVKFSNTAEFNYESQRSVTVARFVRSGVLALRKPYGFRDTWGGSINSLPKTLWELTPFSWAVDYLWNVGDFIASRTPDTFFEAKDHYVSVTNIVTQTTSLRATPRGDRSGDTVESVMTKESKLYSRSRILDGELPGITFLGGIGWPQFLDIAIPTFQMAKDTLSKASRIFASCRTKRR